MAKWKFMSEEEILKVAPTYIGENVFWTIQTWDKEQENKTCPIYADFDGESSFDDAKSLFFQIKEQFGAYPNIYDSGSKGYHVVLPIEIEHPRCELVVKKILTEYFEMGKSWDVGMYRTRAMWRIPNTYNPKGNKRKKILNESRIFNESELKVEKLNFVAKKAKAEIDEYLTKLEQTRSESTFEGETEDVIRLLPPCLKHVLENRPPDGSKHYCVWLLAVFLKNNGLSQEKTEDLILSYNHYSAEEERGVNKTVFNVYQHPYKIGCSENSRWREVLKDYCMKELCVYEK